MLNRRHALTLLGLALALPTLAATPAHAPQEPDAQTRCAQCRMYVARYPRWHTQVAYPDGQTLHFDGPADMFRYLGAPARLNERIAAVWAVDHLRGGWIDGKAAFYVHESRARGPMGADLPAFARRDDADAFARDMGGRVLGFDEAMKLSLPHGHSH